MKRILYKEVLAGAFNKMRAQARSGIFDGSGMTEYLKSCKWWIQKYDCSVLLTRDVGYHTCGWWKNPDYERCWHLSIAFHGGKNKNGLKKIIDGLFGDHKRKLWIEPPYSDVGKSKGVWHYRLFCDEQWDPIVPRGEVYSTQFTERGWKSYSELHDKFNPNKK